MSCKKKRSQSRTVADAGTNDPTSTSEPTRKQRRSEKIREQRTARKNAEDKNKGIRPWILPGFLGIAVIAVVFVGLSTISSDSGGGAGANVPSPVLGERTAAVAIHEYGDFQCPFCGRFARTVSPS